jgi:N-methylhydantoinase B/oxoprolinase/acetone carboxylase alpha subunit
MTASSTFNAFLQIAGPEVPFNHGCFRPVHIVAPRGSLINPAPPGPTFGCTTDTPLRIIDCITGALVQAIPETIIAGSYGTCNCLAGMGTDRNGADFLFWFFYEGGWGAAAYRDGWNSTPNQSANFLNYPVEIIESQYALTCKRVELRPDSGGAGRYRGGLGTIHELEFNVKTVLSGFGDRHVLQPYGLIGGEPGASNGFEFRRAGDADWRRMDETIPGSGSKFANFIAQPGDQIRILNGGGGGYGDPQKRDAQTVLRDAQDGVVSAQSASAAYGVALKKTDQGEWSIDWLATERQRQNKPAQGGIASFDPTSQSVREGQGLVREEAPPDHLGEAIREVLAQVENGYCASICPKGAKPHLCPLYKEEALAFWTPYAFRQWIRRHCPLRAELLERFPT